MKSKRNYFVVILTALVIVVCLNIVLFGYGLFVLNLVPVHPAAHHAENTISSQSGIGYDWQRIYEVEQTWEEVSVFYQRELRKRNWTLLEIQHINNSTSETAAVCISARQNHLLGVDIAIVQMLIDDRPSNQTRVFITVPPAEAICDELH